MFIGNKKCRIYAACGVSQTPREIILMRGGKKMNEFYEAVSNLFEELRCDSGEREYTVQPEEWKEAEKNLKQIQKKLPLHLEKIPEREQNFWNKYLDQLEHFHYEEEQRAYYQGMMDVVEFLINIGAIKKSTNVKRMIEKYAR